MYSKEPTGVGVYCREVWNKLSEKMESEKVNYSCYVYEEENLTNPEKLLRIKLPFGLQSLFSNSVSFHRIIWNIFFLPRLAKHYDLVYSFSSHGSPFIKNQIVTIHDLVCFSFPKQHKFQFLYFKYVMPFILKAAQKIVVISEFTKTEVIKHYKVDPKKIIVILSGGDHLKYAAADYSTHNQPSSLLDEEKKLNEELRGQKFFLTVGASYPHKNVERLIEAINRTPLKASLVISGGASKYYYKLRNFVHKKNIANVIFLEYVSPHFLTMLYRNAIANVYISFNEGFGFPPFEAAMNNKVSIVSNSGALPEIYQDSVCYVNPYSIDDIVKMLTLVASRDFDHCKYQKNFAALFNKYKWTNTVNKISELILKEVEVALS